MLSQLILKEFSGHRSNVCSVKKDTKCSSVLLLRLVSFFTEQTLRQNSVLPYSIEIEARIRIGHVGQPDILVSLFYIIVLLLGQKKLESRAVFL